MNRFRITTSWVLAIALGTSLLLSARAQPAHSSTFASALRKIDFLTENARSANPSTARTVLTAAEWNAYLNDGGVKLPNGISSIHIFSQPGVVHGNADVDFDRLIANRISNNPLLALFAGKHHVTAIARVAVANGIATVHVDSVLFDDVEVPRIALEFFASKYLRPRFGNEIGLDSTFSLHHRISSVIVGANQVTITQR